MVHSRKVSRKASQCLMEDLESRVFLSATTAGGSVLSAAVKADHVQIRIDLLKFKGDDFGLASRLLSDVTNIKKDDLKQATTVVPLIKQMKTDIKTMQLTLKADRLAESSAALADESVIAKELLQILKDQGNPTAVAADRQHLLADRIQLQTDLVAGLNSRITTRQNSYSALIADGQAVVTAAQSDPNASAKLQSDITQWTTDRSNGMTTLLADLQKLVTDRTQLVTDLTAMQTA